MPDAEADAASSPDTPDEEPSLVADTTVHVSTAADTTTPVVTSSAPPPLTGPMTRQRHDIHQPKKRTDGTVAWTCVLACQHPGF
jgi:hypothetical protein